MKQCTKKKQIAVTGTGINGIRRYFSAYKICNKLFIDSRTMAALNPHLFWKGYGAYATVSDDETFEQIKKQLNRMVEVIKVIDFTDVFVRMKEILYIKVFNCSAADKVELFQIAETFKAKVIDYGKDSLLLEFVQTATKNDAVVKLMKEEFSKIEVVRGGSVGIESINVMER